MVKCNSCGGRYESVLTDGSQYFHSCPPLTPVEIRDHLVKGTIRLRPIDQALLDSAAAEDAKRPLPAGEPTRADQVLATIVVERPNKRDENVLGAGEPGKPAPVRAEGAGITKI